MASIDELFDAFVEDAEELEVYEVEEEAGGEPGEEPAGEEQDF
jgi:hypothetical protein